MTETGKKNKMEKQLEQLVKDALTQNMICSADDKFKQLTEHGERSITVFRRIPYQMVDMGDSFYFVELNGFYGDNPDELDLNAVYNFDALKEKKPKHKKQFSIKKCDILDVEIGGKFSGYFQRQCGCLTITFLKGNRMTTQTFYLPGENNQFAVKKFLGDVDVKINPSEEVNRRAKGRFLDKNEKTVIGALVNFFNKKGRAINLFNWLLSAASFLLVLFHAIFDAPYQSVTRGIAALLPLVIYLNYIRYNGILRLVSSGKTAKPYHKTNAECFIKVILPTVATLMAEIDYLGTLVSFQSYFILGMMISLLLTTLFDWFVPRNGSEWVKRGLICCAMCFFYVFTAMNFVNRMVPTLISSEVLDYPSSFGYESQSDSSPAYYGKVLLIHDERQFRISREEYERLEHHELSVQVDQCVGLLGLKYYDFTLVEASEEAQRNSAYLESLPKLPPNPTAEDMEEYQRRSRERLEQLMALAEESNLLVSDTDVD